MPELEHIWSDFLRNWTNKREEAEFYPSWLHRDLVEGSLPWEKGIELTFPQFHEKYTLHDSYWIGLFHDPGIGNSVILCLRWDPVWLPDDTSPKTPWVAEWPFLIIRLEDVTQISLPPEASSHGLGGTIGSAESVECEGTQILTIDDIIGASLTISFKGKATFLALSRDRVELPL